MSSPDINYPAQPSYGEGMADAMKAQMEQLLGQGDYADIYADAGFEGGNLGDILAGVEAPIRQQTAQIDTDVLRQTLLGSQQKVVRDAETGQYGIPGAEVVTGEDGEPQTAGGGRYQMLLIDNGKLGNDEGSNQYKQWMGVKPTYAIIDTNTGGIARKIGGDEYSARLIKDNYEITGNTVDKRQASFNEAIREELLEELSGEFTKLENVIEEAGGDTDAPAREFDFTNPNIAADPSKAGQEGFDSEGRALLKEGDVVRAEDGMIDLLGDKQLTDDGRKPGFDAQGNFLGLSALAEDVQAGNLSRQRERDLADVERLSGRFQDVMEDYRPGTAEAVTGAREVLESQKDRLTGEGQITVPTDDTFGGAANAVAMRDNILGEGPTLTADTSYDAATAADPMALNAATSFTPSAGVTGEGFTATAGLEGGQIQADPLREALMAQAQAGLAEGLTPRERRLIDESQRARATMMGRTFDQTSAIEEAKAQVLEDRNRQNQNRAFAQQILGQEAGLQESDLSRGLQAAMQNQSALNRASEFGAGQDMQAQLANQAATNQALQAGMAAGLSQEALGAQQQQAQEFANMQAQNRASEFGTQAGMQQDLAQAGIDQERDVLQAQLNQQGAAFNAEAAQQRALADQRQKQQAAQFGVGAEMDAERLNAQLAQQGALGYVDAATRLASLEDQTTMDPFAALLNRAGGGSLQAGQGVFGQAGYGLSSGPQYLNPESGLGYISQMAANEANMYGAQLNANAAKTAGIYDMIGSIGGAATGMGMKKLLKL